AERGGERRLKGSGITWGRNPAADASNTQTPALKASSAHSPFALVRVANVFCPRKSLPAKPKIASTCTSTSWAGACATSTLPLRRSSGCAATAAPKANAATAARTAWPRIELLPRRRTAPADDDARAFARVAAVVENDAAVDDDGVDADGILKGIGECGAVGHRRGVEDDEIGREPFLDQAAIAEAQLGRGEAAHLVHGLLQRDHVLLAHILAEHAREGAEVARVRHAAPQRSARGERP